MSTKRREVVSEIRIGIIGIGNMGRIHAAYIDRGEVKNARLTAVCDINPQALIWAEEHLSSDVSRYSSSDEFYAEAPIDAVMVVTPHFSHPELAILGFESKLHVLIEKPAGVGTKQVRQMNAV